ncbi:IS3 family transposase [Lacrimispora sp.]|uniref:IS3 family transposase n=1 Tax=Lacrimispora sp. TaxID=2719234 RepID=UPI0028B1EEC8|nr:IS3 family transposase [Lacrimispora sp.]
MQLEIDLLKKNINVLKKDPGIDQTVLKNREKAVIVDALKDRYSLPILLKLLNFLRSSYYYQKAVFRQKNKYDNICKKIVALFNKNMRCYGYRRKHGLLKREGITISEKIIRRIMQEEDLVIKTRKRKRYNSYQGEISPSVPNLIQRDFHANKPNEK